MNLKYLWDQFTDNYSFLPIHPQYFMKKYTRTGVRLTKKYAHGTLLDIGCGRMPYKDELMQYIEKYIGLDHPETAKLYKGRDKPDIFADATKIPLAYSSISTVIALQVFEHLPYPRSVMKEVKRIQKKDGVVIISSIQMYPLHDEPFDYFRYTKYGLMSLLKKEGYKILDVREEGNIFILMQQSFNIYLMLLLKGLSQNSLGKLLAIVIAPFILTFTTFTNLLALPFEYLDTSSKFRLVITVVGKKI